MKLVYVAGAYRAKSYNEVYENIDFARWHARKLWLKGYAVLCPHLNTAFMDGENTADIFLEGDKVMLKKCDYIYLLPGWEKSRGAKAEYKLAQKLKIPVLKI